jgi:hypothetical protein
VWLAVFAAAFFYQSYEGRVVVTESGRRGCERQKTRDLNAAVAWTVAEWTRRLQGDAGTASAYDDAATTYWRFAVLDCGQQWPTPKVWGR